MWSAVPPEADIDGAGGDFISRPQTDLNRHGARMSISLQSHKKSSKLQNEVFHDKKSTVIIATCVVGRSFTASASNDTCQIKL
jgi:hypothetical protein